MIVLGNIRFIELQKTWHQTFNLIHSVSPRELSSAITKPRAVECSRVYVGIMRQLVLP